VAGAHADASPNNRSIPSHPFNPISEDGFARTSSAGSATGGSGTVSGTCATEWLHAEVPLEKVSKLLGHASLEQTLGYADLVRDDVARSMRRGETDFVTAVRPAPSATHRPACGLDRPRPTSLAHLVMVRYDCQS
jgi:hypothetical protein